MSKRIEHIFKNGVELKWCSRCKQFLPVENFHNSKGYSWDNLFYLCAGCIAKKRRNDPRHNALAAWRGINRRIAEDVRYIRRSIKVKIEKEDFVKWYTENWFPLCRVDRKDNRGNYEAGNIQLISQKAHNVKLRDDRLAFLNVKEPKGMRYCYKCGKVKLEEAFYRREPKISDSNPLGLKENCKVCEREEARKRWKRRKRNDNNKQNKTKY